MIREFVFNFVPTAGERLILAIGALIGWLWGVSFGNHELAVAWLLCIMMSDYVAGVYRACKLGEYQSGKGTQGLIKKFCILWVCALAHGLDVITGFGCIQTAFLGAFGLNEMFSILENLGRVHPHFVPDVLQNFLTDLKDRSRIARKNNPIDEASK